MLLFLVYILNLTYLLNFVGITSPLVILPVNKNMLGPKKDKEQKLNIKNVCL